MLHFCDFIQVYVFTTNHHLIPVVVFVFNILLSISFHIVAMASTIEQVKAGIWTLEEWKERFSKEEWATSEPDK